MSHFAHVNKSGIVDNVIVAEQDFIDTGLVGDPKEWIKTSYNTYLNQHPEGRPLRKNFAGIGFIYDPILDAFLPPKPTDGEYILDEEQGTWIPVQS